MWYLTLREERGLRVYGNRVWREIFRSERYEVSGAGGNCTVRIFIICTSHQILLGDQSKENDMGGACGTCGGEERFIKGCRREV